MRIAIVLAVVTCLSIWVMGGNSLLRTNAADRDTVAIGSDQVDAANAQVGTIIRTLPAYGRDPLSAFEVKEIDNVQEDLAAVENEEDSATLLIRIKTLQADWELLVGLDGVLQKEHLICKRETSTGSKTLWRRPAV